MVYLYLLKKEGVPRDHCSDLAFCQEKLMPKNSYQEIVHSINYKKNIVIENTNIVISYQDTKVLKIYAYRAV